jgi:predicted unusual protein kinase regulating ubiquinone biosynthesis (AarF/ABC1/UbiB family)
MPQSGITFDRLGESLGGVLRLLSTNGFSLPKELVLFFKNLLYLNGLCNSFAPDINLLSEIAPVFLYFQTKYPKEIAALGVWGVTPRG